MSNIAVPEVKVTPPRRAGKLELFFLVLRRQPLPAVCYLAVLATILLALLAPVIAQFDPEEANAADYFQLPGGRHILGTNVS